MLDTFLVQISYTYVQLSPVASCLMNSNSVDDQVAAQMLEVSERAAVLISLLPLANGFYLRLANYIMLFMTYDLQQVLESSNERNG